MHSFFQKKIFFFFFFSISNPPIIHGIHSFAPWNSVPNYSLTDSIFQDGEGRRLLGTDAIKEFFSSRGLSNFYTQKPGLMPLRYSCVYTAPAIIFHRWPTPFNKCTVCRCQLSFIQVGEKRISSFRITIQLSWCTPRV